jgi:glycosyltransferase involved in cell wall biosynthesis
MINQPPLVSIIIAIYNLESYLSKCIDSCIDQTYSHIEIIAVNDGSTDDSLSILEEYKLKDNRIKIVDKLNGGENSSRKSGIDNSTGEFLILVDGDDYLQPTTVESLLSISIREEADFVVAGYHLILAESGEIISTKVHNSNTMYDMDYLKYMMLHGHHTIWGKMYRSSLVKKEIQYPNLKAGGDMVLSMQWALKAKKVVFTPEILYNYVVARPGSVMSGDSKVHIEEGFKAFSLVFEMLLSSDQLSKYSKDLTRCTCIKLYSYLSNSKNQFKKNEILIEKMTYFIWENKKYVRDRQFQILIRLLKIDLRLSHYFVLLMQKIKPTLHPST